LIRNVLAARDQKIESELFRTREQHAILEPLPAAKTIFTLRSPVDRATRA